jgi:hypothetical protein
MKFLLPLLMQAEVISLSAFSLSSVFFFTPLYPVVLRKILALAENIFLKFIVDILV